MYLPYTSPCIFIIKFIPSDDMYCNIESLLQGVGMDSIEDKVREVVDEDVPVSPQNTDPHKTSLLP